VLHELRIENLLLIEGAELRFGEGLNAITGETGAGKTVLAHALDLLLGGKARAQIVRPGAEETWVEGVFGIPAGMLDNPELTELTERLPEGAEEITLGRRIGTSGRTSAFIAGRSASAAELRALGSRLLAFYGQHEHRKLALGSAQLEILDGFAGPEHLARRSRYRTAHREVTRIARELSELRSYLDAGEDEPGRLEAVEERLDALERLKRKHGGTLDDVIEHAARCPALIARLENAGALSEQLERRIAVAGAERATLADALSEARRVAAGELERRVAAELVELAMDGARLEAELTPHPDGLGAVGAETVELRVATNPGMPVSPLKEAASGGELSRIMLALSGLASDGEARTLVFDEIDAGVGGSTARAVGERLRRLAESRQVICITHLPQVASLASAHFRIEKSAADGQTRATVKRVGGEELVAEIVRMLGAKRSDDAAERHARELLAAA